MIAGIYRSISRCEEAVVASLYIKDEETAALAAEVAKRLGTTKTEAVRTALREKKASFVVEPDDRPDIIEWLRERRRTHPLKDTGLKAD